MDGAFDPGGTSWVVTSIDEEPVPVDDPPTIGFDDEGHVSGEALERRFLEVLGARCTVTRTDGELLLTSDGGSLGLAPAPTEVGRP